MNIPTTNSEYLLLFRNANWGQGLSPEELQKGASQFLAWFERLNQQGKFKGGHPLFDGGQMLSQKKGKIVADGPFAESKETIGGYILLQVADMDEAVAIAKEWPGLQYGSTVEVRHVADECPVLKKAKELQMEAAGVAGA